VNVADTSSLHEGRQSFQDTGMSVGVSIGARANQRAVDDRRREARGESAEGSLAARALSNVEVGRTGPLRRRDPVNVTTETPKVRWKDPKIWGWKGAEGRTAKGRKQLARDELLQRINVAELANSNVFMVKDGVVHTPIPNGTKLATAL
jgi:branched-subunit amino acid aminotransferase/4-amino-4-deoxychorismate lyase